jgi:3-phenylpropionate/trans-cinnamate dioxygenase ferredoxin subunit
MNSWKFALEDSQLAEASMRLVNLEQVPILLVKSEGRVFALANKCPHMECPLSAGKLDGFIVKCPCHDWRFDIRTGEFLDAPEIKMAVYESKTEEGKVYVKI